VGWWTVLDPGSAQLAWKQKFLMHSFDSYLIEQPFLYILQVSDGRILESNGTIFKKAIKMQTLLHD